MAQPSLSAITLEREPTSAASPHRPAHRPDPAGGGPAGAAREGGMRPSTLRADVDAVGGWSRPPRPRRPSDPAVEPVPLVGVPGPAPGDVTIRLLHPRAPTAVESSARRQRLGITGTPVTRPASRTMPWAAGGWWPSSHRRRPPTPRPGRWPSAPSSPARVPADARRRTAPWAPPRSRSRPISGGHRASCWPARARGLPGPWRRWPRRGDVASPGRRPPQLGLIHRDAPLSQAARAFIELARAR